MEAVVPEDPSNLLPAESFVTPKSQAPDPPLVPSRRSSPRLNASMSDMGDMIRPTLVPMPPVTVIERVDALQAMIAYPSSQDRDYEADTGLHTGAGLLPSVLHKDVKPTFTHPTEKDPKAHLHPATNIPPPTEARQEEEPKLGDKQDGPSALRGLDQGKDMRCWAKRQLHRYYKHINQKAFRDWVEAQHLVEWRRYRPLSRSGFWDRLCAGADDASACKGNTRVGTNEFLVVKIRNATCLGPEVYYLCFERNMVDRYKDRGIELADKSHRPYHWQKWLPNDRVTMLKTWPNESLFTLCASQVFHSELKMFDLLIAVCLTLEASWTDFHTRHSHWFAVLLSSILKVDPRPLEVEQPVVDAIRKKFGGFSWLRKSSEQERRKIVEHSQNCSVRLHKEKTRMTGRIAAKIEANQV
ncbi:hypothetical protein DXG01_017030 [Tephrocybe rancida]|nr:hypothetical protein DXG01_017030 [Tephrocybe rancida]